MSFFAFAQLVTTFIFFPDKSRVKWDNSRNSTQKMRTIGTNRGNERMLSYARQNVYTKNPLFPNY